MEEHLNYATVTFAAKNGVSTFEKPSEVEIIYDEVKPEVQAAPVMPVVKEKKTQLCLWRLVAAGLGIVCVILVVFIIVQRNQFQTESERLQQNSNLAAAQIKKLDSEKNDLQGQTDELTRERDGLNWTLRVILEYKKFPVDLLCPQKVCKPCQDKWVQFQSSCYLFDQSSWNWLSWSDSKDECQKLYANLVVIESKEEQEFINNHTEKYNDDNHGYWIGLTKKEQAEEWQWLDGSSLTEGFWRNQETIKYWYKCALTSPHGDSQDKWRKTSCDMRNRYICETKMLTRQDDEAFT